MGFLGQHTGGSVGPDEPSRGLTADWTRTGGSRGPGGVARFGHDSGTPADESEPTYIRNEAETQLAVNRLIAKIGEVIAGGTPDA